MSISNYALMTATINSPVQIDESYFRGLQKYMRGHILQVYRALQEESEARYEEDRYSPSKSSSDSDVTRNLQGRTITGKDSWIIGFESIQIIKLNEMIYHQKSKKQNFNTTYPTICPDREYGGYR